MRTARLTTLLLLLAWRQAGAQLAPAEQFFNSGAQFYISNNIPAALERVEMGLKTYPEDEKLKKLEELLKQQQQQDQQNQQQQDQQNQQQQNDQQKKSDEQKQQEKKDQEQQGQEKNSDQQKQDEQKQNPSDQKKNEEQKPDEQKKDSSDQPNEEQPEPQPGQPVKLGEMTPEEAKRLLDAQKGKEQLLQLVPQGKPHNPNKPVKDW